MKLAIAAEQGTSPTDNPWRDQVALLVKTKEPEKLRSLLNLASGFKIDTKDFKLTGKKVVGNPKAISFKYKNYSGVGFLVNGTLVVHSANMSKVKDSKTRNLFKGPNLGCAYVNLRIAKEILKGLPMVGDALGNVPWGQLTAELTQKEYIFYLSMKGMK